MKIGPPRGARRAGGPPARQPNTGSSTQPGGNAVPLKIGPPRGAKGQFPRLRRGTADDDRPNSNNAGGDAPPAKIGPPRGARKEDAGGSGGPSHGRVNRSNNVGVGDLVKPSRPPAQRMEVVVPPTRIPRVAAAPPSGRLGNAPEMLTGPDLSTSDQNGRARKHPADLFDDDEESDEPRRKKAVRRPQFDEDACTFCSPIACCAGR